MSEDQTTENTETKTEEATTDIPSYVPEKFWNKDLNEVNVEEMGASYKALEKRLGQRTDELAGTIREEVLADIKGQAPDAYEIKMPELPDGVQVDVDPEQPLLQWWQETAKSKGLSNEDFNKGIEAFVQNEISGLPDRDTQINLLGENATQRIESADLWAKKNLSESSYAAMANIASTADGVKAIEEIMSLNKDAPIPSTETKIDVSLDPLDLRSMMNDERYWKDGAKDPAYIKKVTDLYEKYANKA
jgi:hypothetical protein|tara:strand:- start:2334 stop:3074 length:741 start_codon:yes stop_codon:yes gene_type:complete